MRLWLIALVALLFGSGGHSAFAQGAIVQSGPVTAFHAGAWFQSGVQADAGTPQTPFLSSLGFFNGNACPLGVNSSTGPGINTAAYQQFTACEPTDLTTYPVFTWLGLNGAPQPAYVYFDVGGTLYKFPECPSGCGGGGSGTVTSINVSGGTTGLTFTGGPVTTIGTITEGGILAVASGGTGTATPGLVAGTNITVTGSWPNQTITATGGAGGVTSFNTRTGAVTLTAGDITGATGVVQSGSVTTGHCMEWLSANTAEDSGGACGSGSGPSTNQNTRSITFIISGGGSAIGTGVQGFVRVPFACTIQDVTLLADQTGSMVLDIWKHSYVLNTPPTVTSTITASDLPTLSSAQSYDDTTLTGWTTSVTAGDVIAYNVNSASTVTQVTVALKCVATS